MCKITVVIPNWNGIQYLEVCLSSLRRQTFIEFNTIVVDNGSTDGSIEKIISDFPEVELIAFDSNEGFSKAVNQGIYQSHSDYVVLLNNDVSLAEDWLEKLYFSMTTKEKVFSNASSMLNYYNQDYIDDLGDYYTVLGWAFKDGLSLRTGYYDGRHEIFSACAGAAIYDRKLFDEIGLFDEDFFAYLEDVDLGFRALLSGYKNYLSKDATVYHIGSATTGGQYNKFKTYLTARNSIYLLYKNMPLPLIVLNAPFIIMGIIIKVVFFGFKGLGYDFIKGLLEGFWGLPKFRAKRKVIMSKRKIKSWELQGLLVQNTIRYIYYYWHRINRASKGTS